MTNDPVALITGASRGLGLALARALAERGWRVVVDGRDAARLVNAVASTPSVPEKAPGGAGLRQHRAALGRIIPVAGDVTDAAHRRALVDAAARLGRLDLVVANASELGPSPLPALADAPLDAVRAVYETNVIAPLALVQLVLPLLRAGGGTLLTISSDAAVEAYPRWGVYGPSKAALDHLAAVLGAEEPAVSVYAVDPGDMRTEMHQRAFPDEDISDRPPPEQVVPAILRLIATRPVSGRYLAVDLAAELAAGLTADRPADLLAAETVR
ncbi:MULTISPECIES: SDR family oxidoreductase [unclassified Pseudofrankia]|uniref:SDR family NAD(P)-dependent oxidoreductase n=1 Tax=unclassified Pseudofrankia TaxID=2994372 RepID=UPI0008D919DD|nr:MULTISPECIES: SDR family oxidoreductase [unclassified Pseudofrankia]MDT3444415.1 SDR family oxidoreductase [Pseudofrankia sp. BMG5.37]OHV56459.1 short-chain dehydrogenase [Pseudofrankia sp. BMG5.36]